MPSVVTCSLNGAKIRRPTFRQEIPLTGSDQIIHAERKMGEEVSGNAKYGFGPSRLYYYAKKTHRSNARYADTGVWNWYGFNPILGMRPSLDSDHLSVVAASSSSYYATSTLAGDPEYILTSTTPQTRVAASLSNESEYAPFSHVSPGEPMEERPGVPCSSHPMEDPGSIPSGIISSGGPEGMTYTPPASSYGFVEVHTAHPENEGDHGAGGISVASREEIALEHIGLLAHLDAGRSSSNPWFAYHLLVHRHEDDVDRVAGEHAIEEEAHLLAHEMDEELHFHVVELHHDFAGWWLEWQGHGEVVGHGSEVVGFESWVLGHGAADSGDHETAGGEEHRHHEDTGSYGRHAAEWYWWLMSEWGLTIAAIREHTHIPHFGLYLHAGHMEHEESVEPTGLHGSTEMEETDDSNGFRHKLNGQAHGWWMYVLEGGHSSSTAGHSAVHESSSTPSTNLDWRAMALGISAYVPSTEYATPAMAGHEVPPSE